MNTQTTVVGTLTLLPAHSGSGAADDASRGSEVVFVQNGHVRPSART